MTDPNIQNPIPLSKLPLQDLMLWLADNQIPLGDTYLAPASVGTASLSAVPCPAGFWANTALPATTLTNLPFTGGTSVSGGAIVIPQAGTYGFAVQARVDAATTGASYCELFLLQNGNQVGYTINDDGSVAGSIFPFHSLSIAMRLVTCAVGDLITVQAKSAVGATAVAPMGDGCHGFYISR